MADEDEWKKLSTENKVQHKAWKARAEGYKECIKQFGMWDEKSAEFSKYLGLMKKFVTDSNELIRLQGLEACLKFVENAHVAPKTCGEVMNGIISKCFSAKPRHKALGTDVCLMFIERDQNEHIQDELLKGVENKNPKVAAACIETLTLALSVFGSKVVTVKPLLKQTPKLLDHRDKTIRDGVKALYIEVYKWIGGAIRTPLHNINAIVLKELEEDWSKIGNEKSKQSRFMRSQQDLKEKAEEAALAVESSGDGCAAANEEPEEVDSYDLLDPVEILSKIPKDYYEKIEAKKWQERKEALSACLTLCETLKIEPGDFGDLVRSLKKVISKDTNIMLVTIAIKCINGLANGLRKKFQPYASIFVDTFIEKFKEKKITVVKALQDAIDAVYRTTSMQSILETVIEGVQHKNPCIREQTGLFLARAIKSSKSKSILNKSTIKALCVPLIINSDHSTPNVREAAFESLGALLKLVGDKVMAPYLMDIDKIKMDKISEFAGRIQDKTEPPKKQHANLKPEGTKSEPINKNKAPEKTKTGKKIVKKKTVKPAASNKKPKVDDSPPVEAELSEVAIDDAIAEFLSEEIKNQIMTVNWKQRLEGLQQTVQKIKLADKNSLPCQAIVFTLGNGKPGWADANFNCLNTKFEILKLLATYGNFSRTSAVLCLKALTDKIGDVKCGNASKEALLSISECCLFPWVADQVLDRGMTQKNPKIQAETLNWLSMAIKEFGINKMDIKNVISKIKQGIAAINPAVRTAAFGLTGTFGLYVGEKIRMFFDDEKPAVLQLIDNELVKIKGQSPPVPTRGKNISEEAVEETDDEEAAVAVDLNDLMDIPRVNIASKLTDSMLEKLADKNWKIRKEGLEEVTAVLNEAKFIEAELGDLPGALKLRLGDSNKVLVTTTLNLLSQISVALGPHSKKHVKTFIPNFYKILSDSKSQLRQASIKSMNQWLENSNLNMWLEDDVIASSLSVPKHIFVRIELLNWLSEKLLATPKISVVAKEGLESSIKQLCSCIEDRNVDVRAKGQSALPAYIYHLGLDKMMRACGKHASNSNQILAMLESAKANVPQRTSKAALKSAQKIEIDIPVDKSEMSSIPSPTEGNTEATAKPKLKTTGKNKRPAPSKKAETELVTTDMITIVPNGKEQRIKDEQKLKTLKWIFKVPREELITQLRNQCSTCMNSELVTEMFHSDFQHHLKAITILSNCLHNSWDACIGSFDLQLRWFTLRFYDTNTTVHIKCLEYLKNAFDLLISNNIRLTDYEANSFLPHLLIKIGENKDNIRKGVHNIILQIGKLFPASKIFSHLMTGLTSKNSRQRSECLDELSILIGNHGIDVCQPTPAKALKELASHIGDRDKGVRSAALNVIVAAYNVCGELVYKYVGNLPDKDRGMLEERIKRSGNYQPKSEASAKKETKLSSSGDNKPDPKTKPSPPVVVNTSHLHSTGNQSTKEDVFDASLPELLTTDCDELINIDPQLPAEMMAKIERYINNASQENAQTILKDLIVRLGNKDISVSLLAIHQLNAIWENTERRQHLKNYINQILMVSAIQLRNAMKSYFKSEESRAVDSELNSFYKSLVAINISIFADKEFALLFSLGALEDAIQAFIMCLIDPRWTNPENFYAGKAFVTGFNRLVLNICSNCEVSDLICALLGIILKTSESTPNAQIDTLTKCLWRITSNRITKDVPQSALPLLKQLNNVFNAAQKNSKLYSKQCAKTYLTLVSTLCKIHGTKIVEDMNDIEGEKSELTRHINREMAKLGFSVTVNTAVKSAVKENMGNSGQIQSLDAKLSAIFKKIGTRELTKMGLEELYIFKQENPYYDIEPEISNVSPLFKNYITRGLEKIEQEKLRNGDYKRIYDKPEKAPTAQEATARFELLRAKCGISTQEAETSKPSVLTSSTKTFNQAVDNGEDCITMQALKPTTSKLDPVTRPATAPTQRAAGKSSNIVDLKRRLENIRRTCRKPK